MGPGGIGKHHLAALIGGQLKPGSVISWFDGRRPHSLPFAPVKCVNG